LVPAAQETVPAVQEMVSAVQETVSAVQETVSAARETVPTAQATRAVPPMFRRVGETAGNREKRRQFRAVGIT